MSKEPVVIIGAGPAGLAAAYELVGRGIRPLVLERASKAGGIARTEVYKDYYFDIGGHRFFSKSNEIESLWTEILPNDMLERPRSSRIYYNQQFFSYPLKLFEVLSKLGLFESIACCSSYLNARLFPVPGLPIWR